MPPNPIVSVIIPTYNRKDLLKEAVRSVLDQSFTGFELVVVDDGSTDGTSGLLASRAGMFSDPRLRSVRIDHSGYPGLARNRGIEAARGRYIAFLDSDDVWLAEKLDIQLDFMKSCPEFRISHTRETWIRGGREVSQSGQRHSRQGMIFEDALKKCIIGPSTVLMEKNLFNDAGGFREDLEIAEDYELWLRITSGERVGYIDKPLTVKRAGHSGQLSEKYGHIEYFRIQGLKDLVDAHRFPDHHAARAIKELSMKCAIYAAGCRKRGRLDEAAEYENLARYYN